MSKDIGYQLNLLGGHPEFDGETYDHGFDYDRLGNQAKRTWDAIVDGRWHTLAELARITGDPEASISARLRDFRKEKWGSHNIEHRRRPSADPRRGIWEYRLNVDRQSEEMQAWIKKNRKPLDTLA